MLEEVAQEEPDLVLFGGDLTWGPLPRETLALAAAIQGRTLFVRGNAERALLELVTGARVSGANEPTPRERWLLGMNDADAVRFLAGFAEQAVVRAVAGVRSVNPGSVGMPYQTEPGAYWALLGPDLELRRTA